MTGRDARRAVDPDVDLHVPAQRAELAAPARWRVLAAIAVGGVIGAQARYVLGMVLPHRAGGFPWATLLTNVSGCLLIGVLMVLVTERYRAHPLARPLLGVGVLGGYTTFSTYTVEALGAVVAGRPWIALGYVVV
ncbi:fluoride efflux transporter FluC, partial [Pseudonocardia abyssalis]